MRRVLRNKYYVNGRNNASKSIVIWELSSAPFLQESNFRNKQSMVQYPRSNENGCWIIEKEQNTNHT